MLCKCSWEGLCCNYQNWNLILCVIFASPGYSGAYCEEMINFCDPYPCQHDGICENDPLVGNYSCKCQVGRCRYLASLVFSHSSYHCNTFNLTARILWVHLWNWHWRMCSWAMWSQFYLWRSGQWLWVPLLCRWVSFENLRTNHMIL